MREIIYCFVFYLFTSIAPLLLLLFFQRPFSFLCQTVDDVTTIYTKHAAASNDSDVENAQSIIVDTIRYFYERALCDNSPDTSEQPRDGNDVHFAVDTAKDKNVDSQTHLNSDVAAPCDYVSGSRQTIDAQANDLINDDPRLPYVEQQNDASSGNTVLVSPSVGDDSSLPDSIAETVKVSSNLDGASDQFHSSQGFFLLIF